MPRGTYVLASGASEAFACAPGPVGWRYVGSRPGWDLDLVTDDRGVTTRLALAAGGWHLRGGAVGPDVLWRRGTEERQAAATGFTGSSPGLLVALARRLAMPVGERRTVRLVELGDAALASRTVEQAWHRLGPAVWELDDLQTGAREVLELDGDVAVRAPGLESVTLV